MTRRIEAAANVALLVACVVVVGLLLKDRVWAERSVETPRAAAPRPQLPTPPPAPPAIADPLAIGPSVATAPRDSLPAASVAAVVNGDAISLDSLRPIIGARMLPIEEQEYAIRRAALDGALERVLLEQEAHRQGVTIEQLVQREIARPIGEPSSREIGAALARNRGRFDGMPDAQARSRVSAELRQQRLVERRRQFIDRLRAASDVRVLLAPPRAAIAIDGASAKGAARAQVTLVEFSDFQCPFCAKSQETLRRLQQRYPDRLRVVFKHFPLPIHQHAARAAEAAECAGAQQRFWEMHDRLFAETAFADADLTRYASEIGVDTGAFTQCLSAGTFSAKWQRDKHDAPRVPARTVERNDERE
jgi:hypothetical protein